MMDSPHIMNRPAPEDDDLGRMTVRELIMKLALVEDELRTTTNPGRIAALGQSERAIVTALRRDRLSLSEPGNPKALEPSIAECSVEGTGAR